MNDTSENRPARRTWWRIALPVSLVLNLFFVALIGGHMLHTLYRGRNAGSPLARALANAEAVLPAQDAARFGAVIRGGAPQYMKSLQQLGEARRELDRQMLADQFDPDGFRRALAQWETAWNGFLNDLTSPLVQALAEISPEGRRNLVAARRAERMRSLP
jgi:uncharacterized membrane protein